MWLILHSTAKQTDRLLCRCWLHCNSIHFVTEVVANISFVSSEFHWIGYPNIPDTRKEHWNDIENNLK